MENFTIAFLQIVIVQPRGAQCLQHFILNVRVESKSNSKLLEKRNSAQFEQPLNE